MLPSLPMLISFGLFLCGWLITIISYIVFINKIGKDSIGNPSNNWNWWTNINTILVGALTFYAIFTNAVKGYRIALVVYIAISFQWSLDYCRSYIYAYGSYFKSGKAFGYGHLILAIVYFVWILYFGCDSSTTVGKTLGSEGGSGDSSEA